MSSKVGVHFIGGPLSGKIEWLIPQKVNLNIYKLYPTAFERQMYGIPIQWMMERLGFVEVVSENVYSADPTYLEFISDMGKSKISRTAQDKGTLLLPLSVKTTIEDYEFDETFRVKTVQISALATLPIKD